MPKVYRITGTSTTRPEGLPAGFDVEEETTGLPIVVPAHAGGDHYSFQIEEEDDASVKLSFRAGTREHSAPRLFMGAPQLRVLRDALNEYLGDTTPTHRVFKDCDEDLWFEVAPDRFTTAYNWHAAMTAARSYGTEDMRAVETLNERWGPLTDVTAIHPRPTR
jgi:hypothetical protein